MNTSFLSRPQVSAINPILQVALTANLVEWYDLALSGYMALEIGKLFFPATSAHKSLMLSFAVFALSFLIRPIGGIFFGLWGNRQSAGAALKLSLILMAIPTALIAFLPTYQTAGYWATSLLILFKIIQGFAAGGEEPLANYYIATNTEGRNRGLYCATVGSSPYLGFLLASFIVFALPFVATTLSARFPKWMDSPLGETWRWPFLLSIPLSFWVFQARSSILKTARPPVQSKSVSNPKLLRTKPLTPLIQASLLMAFGTVQIYMLLFWMPSYLHSYIGVPLSEARAINIAILVTFITLRLLVGYSMRWIAAPKLTLFAIVISFFSYPLFSLLQRGELGGILFAQLVFACSAAALTGILVQIPDLFKDNWQSLGITCAYSIPISLFGGTAPVICSFLIAHTHLLAAPALYLTFMGLLALPVAYRLAFPRQQKKTAADSGYEKSAYAQ